MQEVTGSNPTCSLLWAKFFITDFVLWIWLCAKNPTRRSSSLKVFLHPLNSSLTVLPNLGMKHSHSVKIHKVI